MSSKSLIRAFLSLSLVILIVAQLDLRLLAHTTSGVQVGVFVLAVVLMIVQIVFLSLRWHAYMRAGNEDVSFKTSLLINLAGYFANILFIASVGGIIAKSGLAMRHGLSVVHAVFITMLDRFMTLAALIFFSVLALPFLQGVVDAKILFMLGVCISFIVVFVGAALVVLRSGLLREYILASRGRARTIVALRHYMTDARLMRATSLYSILGQAVFFISVFALAQGIDPEHANTLGFFALLPILALISSLPISFGGWGVREGVFVYGLGLIGFSMESAFLLSIQVGLASLVAPFIVGLPYFLRDDFKHFLQGENAEEMRASF